MYLDINKYTYFVSKTEFYYTDNVTRIINSYIINGLAIM